MNDPWKSMNTVIHVYLWTIQREGKTEGWIKLGVFLKEASFWDPWNATEAIKDDCCMTFYGSS